VEPLLLKPYYVSPVWGGPRIAQARGIAWTSEDNHGESFDVSAHPSTMGVVRNGPYAGCTLAEAIAAHHDELLGNVPDDAPLQITTMDAAETLSVQVHPPEAYAQAAEGDHGKVE
jgi:mannose-6-phosphate isomerase